jgi:hypothetical protein
LTPASKRTLRHFIPISNIHSSTSKSQCFTGRLECHQNAAGANICGCSTSNNKCSEKQRCWHWQLRRPRAVCVCWCYYVQSSRNGAPPLCAQLHRHAACQRRQHSVQCQKRRGSACCKPTSSAQVCDCRRERRQAPGQTSILSKLQPPTHANSSHVTFVVQAMLSALDDSPTIVFCR